MFLFKGIVLCSIFLSSFYIGVLISKKYSNRVKELKEMKNALNMFETKIKFTYASLPEIFEEISNKIENSVGEIFKKSVEKMNKLPAGKAWEEAIDEVNINLKKEDKIIIKGLGRLLGKTDIEGQISEIKLVNNFLDTQIRLAEEEKLKNEKMYKTLGGIVGLAIVIILI